MMYKRNGCGMFRCDQTQVGGSLYLISSGSHVRILPGAVAVPPADAWSCNQHDQAAHLQDDQGL